MNEHYQKEIIILTLQALLFYIIPLFAGLGDEMDLVVLLILATFLLSVTLGAISDKKIRFLYPFAVGILFIPSVFIYYNSTALIYIAWYLVISAVGIVMGALLTNIWIKRN